MPSPQVTAAMEYFLPDQMNFGEVTLLDCNDSFTHNLVQAFLKLGAPVRVFRSHQVTVEQVSDNLGSYLVLSPGPGTPDEGGIGKSLYMKVRGSLPVLGVCLGMQCINEVHGGSTISAPHPVHGKVVQITHDGKGIFSGISSPTPVARYHSLMVHPAESLQVQSEVEGVIMAGTIPGFNTVVVQFHPESFLTTEGLRMLSNFLEGHT